MFVSIIAHIRFQDKEGRIFLFIDMRKKKLIYPMKISGDVKKVIFKRLPKDTDSLCNSCVYSGKCMNIPVSYYDDGRFPLSTVCFDLNMTSPLFVGPYNIESIC